jgi:hypothetical protein
MNEELLKKVLTSLEEEKLSALFAELPDEDIAYIEKMFDAAEQEAEPEKESSEKTGKEDEAEKVASDMKAAGKFFGMGFVDAINQAAKPE